MIGLVVRTASVMAIGAMLAGCAGQLRPGNTARINFGEVYVGHRGTAPLTIDESGGGPVDVVGLTFGGQDATAFSVAAPTIPPTRTVAARGSLALTLGFQPDAARRFGVAEFTPLVAGGSATGFPVQLLGTGVYWKRDLWLSVAESDHPSGGALDFDRVPVGQSREKAFFVTNDHAQSLTLSLAWIEPGAAFGAPGGTSYVLPARSRVGIPLRFSPAMPGRYRAIVELRDGAGSMAGVVLTGEGVPAPATAGGASLGPLDVVPGATLTLEYSLHHPDGLQVVSSATIEGLPPNATGGGPLTVPVPQGTSGNPTAGSVRHSFALGPPAMDGRYRPRLVIRHHAAADTVVPLGELVVRDVPAVVDGLAIRDDHHRRQCEPGIQLVARSLEYRVTDDNGATDVLNARIREILPAEHAEPLHQWQTVPLDLPRDPRAVSERVTTRVDLLCRARAQGWTLVITVDEDDKTQTPAPVVGRIEQRLPYRVDP